MIPQTNYYDTKSGLSKEEYQLKLKNSCTVYVGNISINTTEDNLHALFSRCGKVKVIHMGITESGGSAGFCFVE